MYSARGSSPLASAFDDVVGRDTPDEVLLAVCGGGHILSGFFLPSTLEML